MIINRIYLSWPAINDSWLLLFRERYTYLFYIVGTGGKVAVLTLNIEF